jgi:hypothetical protein
MQEGLKILTKPGLFLPPRQAAIHGRVQPCPICFIEIPAQDWHGDQLLIPNANLRNSEIRSLKFEVKERNTERREAVRSSPLERKQKAGLGS